MGSSQLHDVLLPLSGEQLDLLERLVNIDSGTDDKAGVDAVGRVMHAELERLGLGVEADRQPRLGDHLVATKAGTSAHVVLLVGHLDTVFAPGTATARPFRVEGTRAYGPGVYDMCGGLVVLLYALRGLREVSPDAWDRLGIRVVLNSDEEPGSDTSRELIAANARESDFACILEPARPGGEYVRARKGVARYVIRVLGTAAHAGNQPQLGANAIAEIAAKVVELHRVTDFASGLTVNVGVIRGGERVNVVPDWAECEVEARLPTQASFAVFEAALERVRAPQLVPGTSVEISGGIKQHPMEPRDDAEPLWSILREAGAEIGFEVSAIATGGASDGNTTSRFVPTLDGMGPRGDFAHSPREYVELPSLLERTEALARFLERWVESR
jgi:glutamate carboxypeptidase